MIDAPEGELNIKDFVIPEPKKSIELPFVPQRDILFPAWGQMSDFFTHATGKMHFGEVSPLLFINLAANARLLAGEHSERVPKIDNVQWDIIDRSLLKNQLEENWNGYIETLSAIRRFDPERAMNEKYTIDDERWDKIKAHLDGHDTQETRDYFTLIAKLKIIDPQRQIDIPAERWKKLKDDFIFQKEREATFWDKPNLALNILNDVKIINPAKLKTLSYPTPDWTKIKQGLQRVPNSDDPLSVYGYMHYAGTLMMFQAQEIDVTENGLELKMPTSATEQSSNPTLPEVRNF